MPRLKLSEIGSKKKRESFGGETNVCNRLPDCDAVLELRHGLSASDMQYRNNEIVEMGQDANKAGEEE